MALTKAQKRAKKLKKKKNIPLQPMKLKEDSLDGLSQILGTSTKVGEKNEAFSSGRISVVDRVSYGSPSEEDLLIKFKKIVLEENFKRISDYAELNADFEERFYTHDRGVDIDAMNNTLSQEEVHYYFTECPDTGMDLVNHMADLASYAKNKDYLELQKNILNAYRKTFKPRMVGMFTAFKEIPEDMNDIISGVRSVQARYVEGAPFLASHENIKIDTLRNRMKVFLKYIRIMQASAQNSLLAAANKQISENENTSKKPRIGRLSMGELVGTNAQYAIEVNTVVPEELVELLKPLIKEFKEIRSQLKVIPETMINSKGTLDYSLAKQAFKSSGLKLGSTDDYLKIFKPLYSRMIALINSMAEISYSVEVKIKDGNHIDPITIFIEEEFSMPSIGNDMYNPLMNEVEKSVSKFIIFCEEKDLNWNSEISLKKAAGKFNKSWERKVYKQESNEANIVFEEILNEELMSNPEGRLKMAIIESDQYADNRDFLYTASMLNLKGIVESLNNDESKILDNMNGSTVLAIDNAFIINLLARVEDFINDNKLEYNFTKNFVDTKEADKQEIIDTFNDLTDAWLLYINNTVSYYYFAKKVGHRKIVKAVDNQIDSILKILKIDLEYKNEDSLETLKIFAKIIPPILIFANRKTYKFNSVELAEELNTKYLSFEE